MQELAYIGGTEAAQGRIILAHRSNGTSLAAVRGGKPVDIGMSFPATGEVPVNTRSGNLDIEMSAYLARTEGFDEMVNFQPGLLDVSETRSDMRDLLEHESQEVRATEAVALFRDQVKK